MTINPIATRAPAGARVLEVADLPGGSFFVYPPDSLESKDLYFRMGRGKCHPFPDNAELMMSINVARSEVKYFGRKDLVRQILPRFESVTADVDERDPAQAAWADAMEEASDPTLIPRPGKPAEPAYPNPLVINTIIATSLFWLVFWFAFLYLVIKHGD